MSNRIFFVCAICLFTGLLNDVSGQVIRKDSLISILKTNKSQKEKNTILMSLASCYLDQSDDNKMAADSARMYFKLVEVPASPLSYDQKSMDYKLLAAKIDLRQGLVVSGKTGYDQLVKVYLNAGNWEKAALTAYDYADRVDHLISYKENLKNFQYALFLFEKSGDKNLQEELRIRIINNSGATGDLNFSETELSKLLIFYNSNHIHRKYICYEKLASIHAVIGNPNKELEYGILMLKSFSDTPNPDEADFYYHRMAMIYRDLGQYQQSLHWARKALLVSHDAEMHFIIQSLITNLFLKLNKPKDALLFFQSTHYKFDNSTSDYNRLIARIYGDCYAALRQSSKAEYYYLKMISYQKMDPFNREHFYNANFTIGQFYMQTSQFEKGRFYLNKVLNMEKGIVPVLFIKNSNYLLAGADSAIGNFRGALRYFQLYKVLNDSISNISKSRQIMEIQIQYKIKEKDQNLLIKEKDIKLLTKQSLLQETQLQNVKAARTLTTAAVFILLLSLIALYSRYRLKQRLANQLRMSREQINAKNCVLEQLITDKDVLITEKDNLIVEKEWLVREIHHRVKNNLQITISLLNLQSAYIYNESALEAIRNSQMRMHTMSLIHQKLYQSEEMAFINTKEYIYELINYLKESYSTQREVNYLLEIESMEVEVAQAVPIGLIINEAVTNSIKYAFPDERRGTITIMFEKISTTECRLIIKDNGIGLPPWFNIEINNSLGMNLMKGLTEQLDGEFNIENNDGTQIEFIFKRNEIIIAEY